MKFKDLLFPISLALLTTIAIQYFFFRKNPEPAAESAKSGQSFVAPKSKQETIPLNKEIDFIDEKRLQKTTLTEFETDLAKFVFSNDGASIDRLEFKGDINGKPKARGTVFPVSSTERENSCFLVAFDEKTPYYYKFMGKKDKEDSIEVSYRYDSPASDIIVNKKFTIYKKTYKIDLNVEVGLKKLKNKEDGQEGLTARIFFPSPLMPELTDDIISLVVVNEKGKVQKILKSKLKENMGWYDPKFFGTDSKYFAHVMIDDPDEFAKRAYYRVSDKNKIFSILESSKFDKKNSWTLSFYFGPKEEKALAAVDPRLEKILEYSGWLAPISKLLLALLKFLYKYLKNYGLAILAITFLIRLILLPFSIKAEGGMKKRLEFQKKLDYLQKKHKHDKAALARERAELIKKHGMPGLGGCLPLLLQLPLFFALTAVLRSSIELYKAPFLWISDLSAKDPYYVFPILIMLSMLIQAFTVDKKQRFTMFAMALIFGAVATSFTSGLALYIFASVGLGLLQTYVVKKVKG